MKKPLPFYLYWCALISIILQMTNHASAQETAVLEWANRIGGTGADRARDLVLDASGNIYVSGFFQGTVDFDPGPAAFNMTSTVTGSAFAAKYDPIGNLIWAKSYGGGGAVGQSITVDGSGNVYITGGFVATGDFDPGPGVFNMTARTTTESDIYFLKLDVNGDFVWAKEINGGTWFDNSYEIKLDAAGNVFVIGRFYFQGGPSFDFDPGPGTFLLTATHEDIFILKLDNDGNFVWARDIGAPTGSDEHRGYSIDIDNAGNVYATGYFEGTVDFDFGAGTTNLTATGDWDVFFMKVDNNGNFAWARKLTNSAPTYYTDGQYGSKIEVDAAGNIYTSGRFNGTTDFDLGAGTFNLTSNGDFDAYLLKMTTDGDFVWAKSWGGTQYDEGFSLSTTSAGVSYVIGSFRTTVDFDPGVGNYNLTSAGADDVFISKFDENGNLIWARSMGGTSADLGYGVATNSADDVIVTGTFLGTADFDPSPGTCVFNMTASAEDIFITKLNQVATLSIASTSISSGAVGSTVIITGTGFSATPSNNTVSFNGTTATVTAITTTSITTTIPAGATAGKIFVTVNCVTVQSATDFNVTDNFVTRWNLATTGSGTTQLSFGTATSGLVNYTWQEISPGMATGSGSWSGSTLTITGLPTGATIRLQIAPTNFQRINASGTDRNRLVLIDQWGTTAWTSMQNAFRGCTNLQIAASDVPNLSGVTDMSSMFESCRNLNSPSNMGTWNTTTVTNMTFMFYDATVFNQDIGAWNTSAVTNMNTMFSEALAFNQDIGSWNTAAVTDMSDMFGYTAAFNQDISGWNTGAVTDMSFMFRGANAFNQNISLWNTTVVTDMRSMFRDALAFNQNIGAWTLNSAVNLGLMFDNSGMNCNNYSSTLIGWSANPSTPNGRTLGATGRQYGTNAVAARTNLTTTKGWTISGDSPSGTVCNSVALPTIISFTSTSGPTGTIVIITGTNFSTTPADNIVTFNGITALVTASTLTTLTVIVPQGATTGKISVSVAGNTATSVDDFIVTAASELTVYNAVSSNGDLKNDYFRIENIETLEPDNTVTIYNRWGSEVWFGENYDNSNVLFIGKNSSGNELPSGTYFYKIFFKSNGETQNGFLVLKR